MVEAPDQLSDGSRTGEIPQCWSLDSTIDDGDNQGEWESYWDGLNEKQRLFREQADEYFRNLDAKLGLDPEARVLDFGCGFGYVAERVAPRIGEIYLWDASANMRRRARLKVGDHQKIRFLDLSDPKSPSSGLQFDLILVNSVVQYMTLAEFSAWLLRWENMLAPGGRVVVSDLIPPNYPALRDIVDLLRFSARRGFLVRAIWQALSEIWRYWGVRRVRPLSRVGRKQLCQQAKDAGLAVTCLSTNLTHFKKRLTAVFTHPKP